MNRIKGIRFLYRKIVLFLVNYVFVGTWFYKTKRILLNSLGFRIGNGSKVVGPVFCTAQLVVGNDCWIGKDLRIYGNGRVLIGDNCDIAPEVVFVTGGHLIGDANRRAGEGVSYSIHVGNGSWIGTRSTLLKNVNVGSGCVIASCACVTKSIKDGMLVGGVPARIIKKLD